MTSHTTIIHLKSIFARYGIPKILYTDGGSQYKNQNFLLFSKQWDFEHRVSSAHYPQSNGMAERYVQTIKNLLKKSQDPYLALLEYRNTPISDELSSPAELMFGRQIRGLLLNKNDVFQDKVKFEHVKEKLLTKQKNYKHYFDRGSKSLPALQRNDTVFVDNGTKPYTPGKITSVLPQPRSYEVLLPSGRKVVRNRKHLYKNNGNFTLDLNRDFDDENPMDIDSHKSDQVCSLPDNLNQSLNKNLLVDNNNQTYNTTRSGRMVKKPDYLKDYV